MLSNMAKNLDFHLDATFIQSLEQLLQQYELELSAAEFHGNMSGLACSGCSDTNIEAWQNRTVGQHLSDHDTRPFLDTMSNLIALIRDSLELRDFGFQLLLPEYVRIEEHTAGLTNWCRGFTLGFSWNKAIVKESLEPDAIEALSDIAQIADAEADENTPESEERALVELEEYVRVCVQLIYEAVHSDVIPSSVIR